MTETIDRAAIQAGAVTFNTARPRRHHHILALMNARGVQSDTRPVQGFLTSTGRFVDRKEAKRIAHDAGQLLPTASKSDLLFTEDLW